MGMPIATVPRESDLEIQVIFFSDVLLGEASSNWSISSDMCKRFFIYLWGVWMGKKREVINRGSRASRFAIFLIGIYGLMTKSDDKEKQGTLGLIFLKKVDRVLP